MFTISIFVHFFGGPFQLGKAKPKEHGTHPFGLKGFSRKTGGPVKRAVNRREPRKKRRGQPPGAESHHGPLREPEAHAEADEVQEEALVQGAEVAAPEGAGFVRTGGRRTRGGGAFKVHRLRNEGVYILCTW